MLNSFLSTPPAAVSSNNPYTKISAVRMNPTNQNIIWLLQKMK